MLPGNNGLMNQRSQLLRAIGYGMYGISLTSNIWSAIPSTTIPSVAAGYASYYFAGNSTAYEAPSKKRLRGSDDNLLDDGRNLKRNRVRYSNRWRHYKLL